jgi:hypothetical protein
MRVDPAIAWCLLAVALAGCASGPINEPIARVDPQAGYRPHLLLPKRQNNDPHTLFVLSFSGGGTRAAALSYGVLEELSSTEISVDGARRHPIDEVDVITGVSGGSFTVLAYALYGDRLFSEYEERFLKRNVKGALVSRALNPFNWRKFIGGSAGRSELAAEYYDEILFEGATFGDRYSFETVETMKDRAEIWKWRRDLSVTHPRLAGATNEEAEASVPRVTFQGLDVSFDAIRGAQERSYFMNLPTSFALEPEEVDRLREVAARLMRQSAEYRSVARELGGITPD